nr:uncharacterized protein LOC126535352 isoform X1 [Dermacentor andersoni]XP_050042913.1 uncharacterized protein LOC126540168 isoform X1 [Dermacentor andersoni]
MPGCCVPLCSNHSRNGWRMFQFPRDTKRRILWTARIKRDKWQPTNTSCICSAHFEEDSFEQNRADGWKKLKPNAVPTVFSFRPLPRHRKAPKDRTGPAVLSALLEDQHDIATDDHEAAMDPMSSPGRFELTQGQNCSPHDASSSALVTDEAGLQVSASGMNAGASDLQSACTSCAELSKQLADLTRKYCELQELHTQANSTIQGLRKKVKKLEGNIETFGKNIKFLNEDQIQALSRNSNKGSTWSPQSVKQALQIKFSCGTSGYETLRKLGYPLPTNRTLARRLQALSFLPGILTDVIDLLKTKAEGMQDIEKDCVLLLDEMEIARGYELDRAEDVVLGGTTLPAKPDEPAHHALVFMIGGLNRRWKQVIAYHFTERSIDGLILKDYILNIVKVCADISLRIRVVTSDMGSSNRAMWREFRFSSHRNSNTICSIPHPCLEDKELFFTADAAHVLKNIRGQLLSSVVFTISDATKCQHDLPSREVKLEHVRAVVDFDKKRELKVAPKLSDIHVSNGHFTKMKVGVAVQFFREAPAGIRYLIKQKILDPEAETTAWFLELVFKWYALMSSRHPSTALSLEHMDKYHAAIDVLCLASETIRGTNMGSTSQWKPSQAGFLIATSVIIRLQDVLLRSEGYKFFLTSRLLQDCLENLFSVIRLRKPVPSAYDVKCALKLVCVSQFFHTPSTTSYDVDDAQYLIDLLSAGMQEQTAAEIEAIDDSEIPFVEEVTSAECEILFHIGGFLIKGILKSIGHCEQCKPALLGSSSSEHAYLTSLKEYVSEGSNLHYPSDAVMLVLKSCEEHFNGITAWTESVFTMKSPLKAVTAYLTKMLRWGVTCACQEHKETVEKLLVSNYARLRLRVHLRQAAATGLDGHASKTCAGVSLQ